MVKSLQQALTQSEIKLAAIDPIDYLIDSNPVIDPNTLLKQLQLFTLVNLCPLRYDRLMPLLNLLLSHLSLKALIVRNRLKHEPIQILQTLYLLV